MTVQPQIRDDIAHELKAYIYEFLLKFDGGLMRSCMNCSLFNEQAELCTKFKARPPARVIAYGCRDYINEREIPF